MFERLTEGLRRNRRTVLFLLVFTVVLILSFWLILLRFGEERFWDWIVILTPAAVAGVGLLLRLQAERKAALEEKRTTREDALDKQRHDTLTTYFGKMEDLLLVRDLRTSKEDSEVRVIAQAITYSVFRNLDGKRKEEVLRFLYQSGLISLEPSIIKLAGAELWGIYLRDAHLEEANLEGAYLEEAHLEGAHLEGAHLVGAHLNGVHLERAYLEAADLTGDYEVTSVQLSVAESLDNSIMPNGTKYEEWIARGKPDWSQEERKEYPLPKR